LYCEFAVLSGQSSHGPTASMKVQLIPPACWGVDVGMYIISFDGDIDIVITHVNVNISLEFLVTDRPAVAMGILTFALVVINSSLIAVYEFELSSLTVNVNIEELIVTETTGGVRKGSATCCPDDVVIRIPVVGPFSPTYSTPDIYVWNALSKFCNPVVDIVFLFFVTITCSGVLRFSILAIKNPVTLALTFRNLFPDRNLLHTMSLF
jgi:hypothetical protein